MEHEQEALLSRLRRARGIAYYGEILLEVPQDRETANGALLREEAGQKADRLRPEGDVLNVMRNIDVLQAVRGNELVAALAQVFVGPIGAKDALSRLLLQKLSFSVPSFCLVPAGEVGLCRLDVAETGDMLVTLDTEEAAIRDALNDSGYRKAVTSEAKRQGVFYTSLISLGMSRDCRDFVDLLNDVHRAGVITVFDTNYRSYVMERCYPQHNRRPAAQAVGEIAPAIDIFLAGSEDVFALGQMKSRDIQRARREFFAPARPSALCVLKAGKDGVYWRDGRGGWHHRPALPVEVRDTTGAGDAFNAGFLLGWRSGRPLPAAVAFANAVAAEVVVTEGPILPATAAVKLVRDSGA